MENLKLQLIAEFKGKPYKTKIINGKLYVFTWLKHFNENLDNLYMIWEISENLENFKKIWEDKNMIYDIVYFNKEIYISKETERKTSYTPRYGIFKICSNKLKTLLEIDNRKIKDMMVYNSCLYFIGDYYGDSLYRVLKRKEGKLFNEVYRGEEGERLNNLTIYNDRIYLTSNYGDYFNVLEVNKINGVKTIEEFLGYFERFYIKEDKMLIFAKSHWDSIYEINGGLANRVKRLENEYWFYIIINDEIYLKKSWGGQIVKLINNQEKIISNFELLKDSQMTSFENNIILTNEDGKIFIMI